MCEYMFKKGKNVGTKCTKKSKVNSDFCAVHIKTKIATEDVASPSEIPTFSEVPTTVKVPTSTTEEVVVPQVCYPEGMINIKLHKKYIEKINKDNLNEICLSEILEILNIIKSQVDFVDTNPFSIHDLQE